MCGTERIAAARACLNGVTGYFDAQGILLSHKDILLIQSDPTDAKAVTEALTG
jgi:hypothetical protein